MKKMTKVEQSLLDFVKDLQNDKNFIRQIELGKYTRSGLFQQSPENILGILHLLTELLIGIKDFKEIQTNLDPDRENFGKSLFDWKIDFSSVLAQTKILLQKIKDEQKDFIFTKHALDILESTTNGPIETHLEWLNNMNSRRFYGILWELGEIRIRGNPFKCYANETKFDFHDRQQRAFESLICCVNGNYPDLLKGDEAEHYGWFWYREP